MQICASHLLTKAPLRNPLAHKWGALRRFGSTASCFLLFDFFLITLYLRCLLDFPLTLLPKKGKSDSKVKYQRLNTDTNYSLPFPFCTGFKWVVFEQPEDRGSTKVCAIWDFKGTNVSPLQESEFLFENCKHKAISFPCHNPLVLKI